MLGNVWDSYDGNLLMETVCWEIRVDASAFFDGGNYGTMLWHHTTISRQWYLKR